MTERNAGESGKEKKEKSLTDWLKARFLELMEKIQELLKKKQQGDLSKEEQRLLSLLQKEEEERRKRFLQTPEGKETEKQKKQLIAIFNQAEQNINSARTPKERQEAIKKLEELMQRYGQKARQFWQEQAKNISDAKLAEIPQYDLEKQLAEAERKLKEADLKSKSEETATDVLAGTQDEQTAQILAMVDKFLKEDPDNPELLRFKKALLENKLSPQELSYGFNRLSDEKERKKIRENPAYRQQKFGEILGKYGSDPARQFREVDMYTAIEWTNFQYALRFNPDERTLYQLRFGFEEQSHNFNWWLNSHAHVDKAPEIASFFRSSMMDVAVRQEGAVAAFRAYEQAFSKLALLDGYLPAAKVGFDPDTKKTWVNNWVRRQVRETLISQIIKRDKCSYKKALETYEEKYAPYELTFIRTGAKIFTLTLRGDEIQASLDKPRDAGIVNAPYHEDLHRVLDPLALPFRYWGSRPSTQKFLSRKESTDLSKLYYFYSGNIKARFETVEEWEKAVKELEEKGESQFNIFDIGGILSVSDWRVEKALTHVPEELTPFLGIEISKKKWAGSKEFGKHWGKDKGIIARAAKKTALAWALKRNPFRVFQLAEEQDQFAILQAVGVEGLPKSVDDKEAWEKARKKFFETRNGENKPDFYDYLAQALQRQVYEQEKEIEEIVAVKDKNEQKRLIAAFKQKYSQKGLDFSFVEDKQTRQKLEAFVGQIQTYFQAPKLDKNGWVEKQKNGLTEKGNEAFERLARKREAFSMGTDDAVLKIMRFSDLGEDALQRRFRDLGAAAQSAAALWNLTDNLGSILQKDENIVQELGKLSSALGMYQSGETGKFIEMIADRILGMVEENNWMKGLPWPACQLYDKWAFTSKAEDFFGQNHLSKGKDELRLLLEDMIGAGIFKGLDVKKVRKDFYKKYHLGTGWILLERAYRYGPAVSVGIVASLAIMVAKELEKSVEQSAKEV